MDQGMLTFGLTRVRPVPSAQVIEMRSNGTLFPVTVYVIWRGPFGVGVGVGDGVGVGVGVGDGVGGGSSCGAGTGSGTGSGSGSGGGGGGGGGSSGDGDGGGGGGGDGDGVVVGIISFHGVVVGVGVTVLDRAAPLV